MEPGMIMLFVWIGMMVAFTVIEAVTVQLVTIWFAVGSLAALIANIAGANMVVQWVVFVLVAAVCLLVTRPVVKKVVNAKAEPLRDQLFVKRSELRALENSTNADQAAVEKTAREFLDLRNQLRDLHDKLVQDMEKAGLYR